VFLLGFWVGRREDGGAGGEVGEEEGFAVHVGLFGAGEGEEGGWVGGGGGGVG